MYDDLLIDAEAWIIAFKNCDFFAHEIDKNKNKKSVKLEPAHTSKNR